MAQSARQFTDAARAIRELLAEFRQFAPPAPPPVDPYAGPQGAPAQRPDVREEPAPATRPPPSEAEKALREEVTVLVRKLTKPDILEIARELGPTGVDAEEYPRTAEIVTKRMPELMTALDACTQDELHNVLAEIVAKRKSADLAFVKQFLLSGLRERDGAVNPSAGPRAGQETAELRGQATADVADKKRKPRKPRAKKEDA
jgi:hypothetical protein